MAEHSPSLHLPSIHQFSIAAATRRSLHHLSISVPNHLSPFTFRSICTSSFESAHLMAAINKRVESFFKKKKLEVEPPYFVRNGGLLMEKLISLSNGRHDIHIRRFTIQEITKATNNFTEVVHKDNYKLYKGNLDGRQILVQIWGEEGFDDQHHTVAFATAISALMSHLKYTLKLIGCCTDYETAAPVYEYPGTLTTLADLLGEDPAIILSWGNRLKIARDVAAMVLYLHTSFPVPIIHRDLKPSTMFIDQNGDAKLFDFSFCIEIPEGESEVEDLVMGTLGFLDPEYFQTSRVTTKSDVYSFGVILLMLLTGKKQPLWSVPVRMHIRKYIEQFIDVDEKLIDRNISQEVGMDEFRAIKDLALSCTEDKADDRPEMIDVARRLHEIEKYVNKPLSRIVPPFEDNGNALKKKLLVLSNGKCDEFPFRIFSSGEIISGTNNFRENLASDTYYGVFKGYLDSCPVLIKKWEVLEVSSLGFLRHEAVVEAAICSLISNLKHVSKFIGCSLEFEIPCLVFEDVESTTTLYEILYTTNDSQLLSWGRRLKIASDIAAVVSHLQTAFPTPILHRDLKLSNVIISQNGEAKLVGFSLAVALPPGKSQVKEDYIFGTWGSLDPDYMRSKFVSIKTDVYSFGVLLLALLTGMNAFWLNSQGNIISLTQFVKQVVLKGEIESLIDPRILQDVEMTEFEAVLDIALRCTRIRGEDRPEMIDVAKLLHQIVMDAIRVNF